MIIQGLTLRPLIVALRLKADDPVALEAGRARAIAYRAALQEIAGDPSEAAEILRLEYRALLLRAQSDPDGGVPTGELPADPLRRRAVAARGNRSFACADPKRSATTLFICSRRNSTAPN